MNSNNLLNQSQIFHAGSHNTQSTAASSNPGSFPRNQSVVYQRNYRQQNQPDEQEDDDIKYDDDEEIQQQVQSENSEDLHQQQLNDLQNMEFSIQPYQTSIIPENVPSFPALISLKIDQKSQINLNQRPGLDLICVIDGSGSMHGEKMTLVQQTLKLMLQFLNENDRICLIWFSENSKRLTPFLKVSKENLAKINRTIDSLHATYSTHIEQGLKKAIKQIKERKFKNSLTSVLLLSDGCNSSNINNFLNQFQTENIDEQFTINTFGYGTSHDSELMKKIAQMKDGNFYYISELNTLDDTFGDALGNLFGVGAQNIKVKLEIPEFQNQDMPEIKFKKVYGPYFKNQTEKSVEITLQQLLKDVSKDFVFELEILPKNYDNIFDLPKNFEILKGEIQAGHPSKENVSIKKNQNLVMDFYSKQEEKYPNLGTGNKKVIVNFFRVQAAEKIETAQKLSDKLQFKEAQECIKKIITAIKSQYQEVQDDLAEILIDLDNTLQTVGNQNVYQQSKGILSSLSHSHNTQQCRATNSLTYTSPYAAFVRTSIRTSKQQ